MMKSSGISRIAKACAQQRGAIRHGFITCAVPALLRGKPRALPCSSPLPSRSSNGVSCLPCTHPQHHRPHDEEGED